MAANRSKWRRWRYIVMASVLVTSGPVMLITLLAGMGLSESIGLSILLSAVAVAGDVVTWWLNGDQLRGHGWSW